MPFSAKSCRYCGQMLNQHQQFSGDICGNWRCRSRQLDADLIEFRDRCMGESSPALPITVIPYRQHQLDAQNTAQLQAYAVRLEQLVKELTAVSDSPTGATTDNEDICNALASSNKDSSALLGNICGACEGYCCYHGGHHQAFLDANTLRRALTSNVVERIEDIVPAYLSFLPDNHYSGSCVYHTRSGCNLPREMRANICNDYECRGLKQARETQTQASGNRIFVVARENNSVRLGFLVTENGISPRVPMDEEPLKFNREE